MNGKDYKIILPLTLAGIFKYGDLYDVTSCNNLNAKFLVISSEEFVKCNIENICLDLYTRYGFLLGDGDYYLEYNDCKILNDYLKNNKNEISSKIYDLLINFCDEVIKLKTGLGFDF